jgi:hypothetical protein
MFLLWGEVCAWTSAEVHKKVKPQLNDLIVNDLDVELTDETLNQLVVEDVLTEEMGQLSLNGISGTEAGD